MTTTERPHFDLHDLEDLMEAARLAQAILPGLQEQLMTARKLVAQLDSIQASPDWNPQAAAALIAATHAIVEHIHEQIDALQLTEDEAASPTLH